MRPPAQPVKGQQQRKTSSLRPHPQAALVPGMSEHEFRPFVDDIDARGIVSAIEITRAGVVADGHQRLRAAIELGFTHVPVHVLAISEHEAVGYMLAAALHRRHLSPSQRAALALELVLYREQRASGDKRKRANLRNAGLDVAALPHRGGRSRDLAAKLAGVSPRLIQNAITVQREAPDLYAEALAGKTNFQRALDLIEREANHATTGETPPLPEGPFEVLYGDPPWPSPSPNSRWSPEQHYQTLPVASIKEAAVPAADNAVLFLWAVSWLLPEALEVMAAWGFEYRSNMVWDKLSIGLGTWVRHEHEVLLIGRRGSYPPPARTRRVCSIVRAKRGRHSEKPKQFYELIEQMYPRASKLELFARGKPRIGWTAWGNQLDDEAAA